MIFNRGTVVVHKVMGRGIVINEVEEEGEKMVVVRMENGSPQNFYPEELETEEEVQARQRRWAEEVNQANHNRFDDPY